MSRGPGKWQRLIIGAIEGRPAVWLRDLLPRQYSAAEYQALYRASRVLRDHGTIAIWTGGFSHSQLIIAKPSHHVRRAEVQHLSVEPLPDRDDLNTYVPEESSGGS